MDNLLLNRFSVIGAGNLGVNLVAALVKQGYTLKYIYKKSKFPHLASYLEQDIDKVVAESDFIFICTQESKIPGVAQLIADSTTPEGTIFYHTANALNSEELAPIARCGGKVASFSPLQTFPGYQENNDLLSGVYFLAEGDVSALALAGEIARRLQAHLVPVKPEEKIYFHIAGVIASNFLISLLKFSERQLTKVSVAGSGGADDRDIGKLDINVLLPLIKQTLKNVESVGVEASLTGPFKRKEMGIVNKHLEYLKGDEATLYKALTAFLAT